jgi:tetratricopeptide (TPR) repeat protein
MGEGTIKTDLSFRRLMLTTFDIRSASFVRPATLLALALCISLLAAPVGAASGDKAALNQLEQRLFFKTYESEDEDSRVGRLEKQVFGSATQGDVHERLERVTAAIGPQENPDGSVSGIRPQQQQQAVAPPVQQVQPQQEQSSPADEQAAAVNRAQVAVQAAREENINRLLGQGVSLWRAKRSHDAIEKFEEVLRLDPGNSEANFSMGIAYESAGNYAEALASYQRAAQQKPESKDYADAVTAVQRKLASRQRVDDKQGELRVLAEEASAAYKRGEYLSALELYKQLDEKAPNQALVKYNIGTLYLAIKNPITALEYYKQARKLKPNEPRYVTACEQLETNVQAAQAQREQVDRAWDAHEASGGMQGNAPPSASTNSNNHKPKTQKEKPPKSAAAPLAPPSADDAMASMGIIAKSTHDGVTITAVGIASRASRVGLLRGDVIKAVEGTVVTHTDQINKILSTKQPGSPVQMTIQRAQKMGQVTL